MDYYRLRIWAINSKEPGSVIPIRSRVLVCGLNLGPLSSIIGMYGPPQNCKRKLRMTDLVCANVFGFGCQFVLRGTQISPSRALLAI